MYLMQRLKYEDQIRAHSLYSVLFHKRFSKRWLRSEQTVFQKLLATPSLLFLIYFIYIFDTLCDFLAISKKWLLLISVLLLDLSTSFLLLIISSQLRPHLVQGLKNVAFYSTSDICLLSEVLQQYDTSSSMRFYSTSFLIITTSHYS